MCLGGQVAVEVQFAGDKTRCADIPHDSWKQMCCQPAPALSLRMRPTQHEALGLQVQAPETSCGEQLE